MILLPHRAVLRVSGADRKSFLQGLVTNDVNKLAAEKPLYALMLNPQGKILFDFIMVEQGEEIWLDCWSEKAQELLKTLTMYKLRAKVNLARDESLKVYAECGVQGVGYCDPRHPQLGSRLTTADDIATESPTIYELHRLSLGIPDSADFIEGRSFPMEFGIADLHGISYTKGCYIGQEIIARSKIRGVLHKALYQITADVALPAPGTPVMRGEAEIGQMRSSTGGVGLAVLRIDEAAGKQLPLTAAGIVLTAQLPDWFSVPSPLQ